MWPFNKSADKRYKAASIKARKIKRKLENPYISERQENRLTEQLNRANDDKKIAKLQLEHPAPQIIRKRTKIAPTVNVNVNKRKNRKTFF